MNACAQQAMVITGWLVPNATMPARAQITASVSQSDCQGDGGSGIPSTLGAAGSARQGVA